MDIPFEYRDERERYNARIPEKACTNTCTIPYIQKNHMHTHAARLAKGVTSVRGNALKRK